MDDNCTEWVWLLGVVVRRYIDFLILLIPTPLVFVLFCSSIPSLLFVHLKKYFSLLCLTVTFSVIKLCFSSSINTHAQHTGVPQQPYEGCTYCFIHEEAHTNVLFISCDGHQLYDFKKRGVDLEVEGMRYI